MAAGHLGLMSSLQFVHSRLNPFGEACPNDIVCISALHFQIKTHSLISYRGSFTFNEKLNIKNIYTKIAEACIVWLACICVF